MTEALDVFHRQCIKKLMVAHYLIKSYGGITTSYMSC